MTHRMNNGPTPKMDVAIATWQPEGIRRVEAMNLPRVPGVRYIVSWQQPGPDPVIPESLAGRDDVSVFILELPGVSLNRNYAFCHCTAEIILNSDDDLVYTADGLQAVIDTFDSNPDLDLACFRYNGAPDKYPAEACDLKLRLPKGFYVATFEMAIRQRVLDNICFDAYFGPGAPVFQSGEDSLFLFDAIDCGYRCRFFPITICTHDHPTTGDKPMPKGVAMAEGYLIRMQYPDSWILRMPLKAWRNLRMGGHFFSTLYYLFKGALIKIQ